MELPKSIKPYSIGTKKIITCPTCDGDGEIVVEKHIIDCPDCNGKGVVEGIITKL